MDHYVFLHLSAITCHGMDSTRPVKVCCGIWHQDISNRSFKVVVNACIFLPWCIPCIRVKNVPIFVCPSPHPLSTCLTQAITVYVSILSPLSLHSQDRGAAGWAIGSCCYQSNTESGRWGWAALFVSMDKHSPTREPACMCTSIRSSFLWWCMERSRRQEHQRGDPRRGGLGSLCAILAGKYDMFVFVFLNGL